MPVSVYSSWAVDRKNSKQQKAANLHTEMRTSEMPPSSLSWCCGLPPSPFMADRRLLGQSTLVINQ